MGPRRRPTLILALTLGLSLIVSACAAQQPRGSQPAAPAGAPAAAPSPKSGGTLTIAMSKDIQVMNPLVRTISTDQVIRNLAFEALLTIDRNGTLQPKLAEKWETSADGKTFTFYLRKGVKFHNGGEMTSADVKFSMDYTMERSNGAYGYERLTLVDHLETPDPYTIRVVLKDVSSTFLPSIDGIETFSVIPKDSLEPGIDKPAAFPPGTGSFMFVSWTPRQSLVFDRFADYWGQKAYVDRVVLKPVEDATVRINALRSGDVDMIERAPYEWVQQIKEGKLAGISMSEAPTAGYRRIVFNWADPPFNNPKLRQAFAYAIDMKEVLQAAYFGLGEVADQKYPKGHQWYIDGVPSFSYDPERAKALLVEAGYNGEPITMIMENAADITAIATTMQAQLKRIGVNVVLQPMEFAAQRDLVIKGQYSFDFMGSNYYDDPFTTYAELLCEDPRNRISNYAGYCNPEVDAWLHQIQHELDASKQKDLLKQVLTKRYEESPHATGVFVPRFYAYRDVVKDFKTDDDQNLIWMSGGLNYAWLDN